MLYKELRYNEIYLATAPELNDPTDLSDPIDFRPQSPNELTGLCQLIFRSAATLSGTRGKILSLAKTYSTDRIGRYLQEHFSKLGPTPISKTRLFDAIRDFTLRAELNGESAYVSHSELCANLELTLTQALANSAIACFSNCKDHFEMWSHYASGHAGVCLEFEIKDIAADLGHFPFEFQLPIDGLIHGWDVDVRPVTYRKKLKTLPFFELFDVFYEMGDIDLVNISKDYWHSRASVLAESFRQKLCSWKHENEWRIINVHFKQLSPEERILNYNGTALRAIYFGARTPSGVKDRVRRAVRPGNRPQFFNTTIDESRVLKFHPDLKE